MTHQPRSTHAAAPSMYGHTDYVLPVIPVCNVPSQAVDDEPQRWAYIRGMLVETCRQLSSDPVVLLDHVVRDSSNNPTAIVVTVVVHDTEDRDITIVWRHNQRGDRTWQLTVNGTVPDGGTGRVRPSPPMLARLIRHATDVQQPAETGSATT